MSKRNYSAEYKKAKDRGVVRKNCFWRDNELAVINEAVDKIKSIDSKATFSYFIRQSALQNAFRITGKRIPF